MTTANVADANRTVKSCERDFEVAALQVEAAIPNFLIHEHHTRAIKAHNREICIQDYQPVNGCFEAPDLPGLGIELNDDVVSRSPHVEVR